MSEETKPIVVYDTGSLLQAALNPKGPAADALDLMDQDQVTACLSPRLRSEIEDVLPVAFLEAIRAKHSEPGDE